MLAGHQVSGQCALGLGRRRGARNRRAGGVLHNRLLTLAAGVGQGHPGGVRGRLAVGKRGAVVDGGGGLGVVLLSQRCPQPVALGHPVPLFGGLLDQRRLQLHAPAGAEDPADQRGDGHHIGRREVGDAIAGEHIGVGGQGVLTGLGEQALGLSDVGVDAGDVTHDVVVGLLPAGALEPDAVDLALQIGLGIGRLRPLTLLHAAVACRPAGEAAELAATGVAQYVHQPQPVTACGEARAELGARAGGAGDVWDAGCLVADDRHVASRLGHALHLVGWHP